MDILSEIIASKRARLEATKRALPLETTAGDAAVRAPGPQLIGCELQLTGNAIKHHRGV